MGNVHGETNRMRLARHKKILLPSRCKEPKMSIVDSFKSCDCTEYSEHNGKMHFHGNWSDSGTERDVSMMKNI